MDVERQLNRIRARRAVCEKANGTHDAAAIEKLKENAAALERNAAMRRDMKSLRASSKPISEDAMARFVEAKAVYQTSVQQELGSYLYELELHRQSKREMDMLAAEIRRLKMENRVQAAARGEDEGIVADIRVLAAAHVAHEEQEEREAMASRAEELLTLKRSPTRQAVRPRATVKSRATTDPQPQTTSSATKASTSGRTVSRPNTLHKGELLTSDYEDSQVLSDQKKKRSPSPMVARKQAPPSPSPLSPSLASLHSSLVPPWPQYSSYMQMPMMGGGYPMMPMQMHMPVPVPVPVPYAMPSPYGYPPPMPYGPPPPAQAWPASPQMPYPYPYPPHPYQVPPSPPQPQYAATAPMAPTMPPQADQVTYSAQVIQPPAPPLVPISAPPPALVISEPIPAPAPAPTPAPSSTPEALPSSSSEKAKPPFVPAARPSSQSGIASPPSFSRGPSLSGVNATTATSSNPADALKKSDELSLLALASRKKMNSATLVAPNPAPAVPSTAAILPIISRVGSESDVSEPLTSPLMMSEGQQTQAPSSPTLFSPSLTSASSQITSPLVLHRNSSVGGDRPSPTSFSRQRSMSISGSPTPGRISSAGGALPGVETMSPSSFNTTNPVRPTVLRIDVSDAGEAKKSEEQGNVRSSNQERSSPSGREESIGHQRSVSLSRSSSVERKRSAVPSDPGSSPNVRSPTQSHGGDAPVEIKVSPVPVSRSRDLDSDSDLMRLGSTRLESKGIDSISQVDYSRSTSQNTTTMATTVTQASTPVDRSSDSRGLQQLQPELCPSPSEIPDSQTPGAPPLNRIQSLPEREKAKTIMEEVEVKEEELKVEEEAAPSPDRVSPTRQPIASIPEEEEEEVEEKEEKSPFLSVSAADIALAAEKEAAAKAGAGKEEKKMESEAMAEEMDAAAEALARMASKPRPAAKDSGSNAGGKKPAKPAMLMSLNLSSDVDTLPGPSSAAGSGMDSKRTTRQSGDITASPGGLYNRSSSISRSQGSFTAGGSTFLSSGHGSSGAISLNQGGAFGRQSLNQTNSMKSIMSKAISKAADDFGDEDDDLEFPSFKAAAQGPRFEAPSSASFNMGSIASMKKFGGSFSMSQSFNDDF